VYTITTRAYIGNAANVDANGSVKVAATESTDLDVIAGNLSVSGRRASAQPSPCRCHEDDQAFIATTQSSTRGQSSISAPTVAV
jgi:hypothetical protein